MTAITGTAGKDVLVSGTGQDDAHDTRVVLLDVGQELQAIHPWHPHVSDNDVAGFRFKSSKRLLAYLDKFFDARPQLNRTIRLFALTHPHKDHTWGVKPEECE